MRSIVRLLGVSVILVLLIATIPAGPALAYSYEIDIDPDTGAIGDEITITGEDFVPSSDAVEKWVRIFFSDEEAYVNDEIDNDVLNYEIVGSAQIGFEGEADEGEFTATFDVPTELTDGAATESVLPGTYYIYCTIMLTEPPGVNICSKAEFNVLPTGPGGEVSVIIDAPVSAAPGTSFTAPITIGTVAELNAAQYDILFDDDVLELTEITEGTIGGTSVPVQWNTIGAGHCRAVNWLGLGSVSGSGYLSVLHFDFIGGYADSSEIQLADGILSGMSGEIAAIWTGDLVQGSTGPYQVSIFRELPEFAVASNSFEAAVTFTAPVDEFNAIVLHDEAPAGWPVTIDEDRCSPRAITAKLIGENGLEYAWDGPYNEGQSFTATYNVTVPDGTPAGTYDFPDGWLIYYIEEDEYQVSVTVEASVTVVSRVISGVIRDVTCAAVQGAAVQLYHDGILEEETTTDTTGGFMFPVSPGNYTVDVDTAGYRDVTPVDIVVTVSDYHIDVTFAGDTALIPNELDGPYFAKCMNRYIYGTGDCAFSGSKFSDIMNAYLYPVTD